MSFSEIIQNKKNWLTGAKVWKTNSEKSYIMNKLIFDSLNVSLRMLWDINMFSELYHSFWEQKLRDEPLFF